MCVCVRVFLNFPLLTINSETSCILVYVSLCIEDNWFERERGGKEEGREEREREREKLRVPREGIFNLPL